VVFLCGQDTISMSTPCLEGFERCPDSGLRELREQHTQTQKSWSIQRYLKSAFIVNAPHKLPVYSGYAIFTQ
jgi:hypothetical protein